MLTVSAVEIMGAVGCGVGCGGVVEEALVSRSAFGNCSQPCVPLQGSEYFTIQFGAEANPVVEICGCKLATLWHFLAPVDFPEHNEIISYI